jgi:hypothetical protein
LPSWSSSAVLKFIAISDGSSSSELPPLPHGCSHEFFEEATKSRRQKWLFVVSRQPYRSGLPEEFSQSPFAVLEAQKVFQQLLSWRLAEDSLGAVCRIE